MTGSIVVRTLKDGTKRYHVVYRAAGKQRWKTFSKRKAADRFLTTIVKSVQDGSYQPVAPILMRDVFEKWAANSLETRRNLGELKPSTAKSYRSMVETHLLPAFGGYRSDRLTAAVVSDWRKRMAEQVAAGKISRKTFNNLLTLLHGILGWARQPAQSYLAHDPLVGQARLKAERTEADFLEDADIAALLKSVANSPFEDAVIHVALFAGLRRGEIFGLRWDDVDTGDGKTGGQLHVRRSLYQGQVTSPKSNHSTRRVDVPQRVLDALARHGRHTPAVDGGFIFRTAEGTPVDPDNFYGRVFTAIRARAQLRSTVGLHSLRHTYASLLIRQNESPKYVSRQLGHGSIQITMDTYGHLFRDTSTQAMKRLNRMIPDRTPKPAASAARLRVVGGRGRLTAGAAPARAC